MSDPVLWACVGWPLAVVIHELGHAIVGRAAGLGIAAIGLGFGIEPAVGARMFGCRLYLGEGGGGLTVIVPRQWVIRRWQLIAVSAGGPVASLLTAVTSGVIWLTAGGPGWAVFGVINFAATVLTLIPHIWDSPAGPLPSDGLSLWQLLRPTSAPALSAVGTARFFQSLLRTTGEPRPFVLYADLAAIEWALLDAPAVAARWRAEADAARIRSVGRLERAVERLADGVLTPGVDKVDRLAELRRLMPHDREFLEYADAALRKGASSDPLCCCRLFRNAALIAPDAGLAADLYREAVTAAFEWAVGLGDHAADLAAFAGATDQMLLAHRRAVRAAGGDAKLATRELLAPIYAGWRVGVDWPQPAPPTPARAKVLNAEGDRRRWRRGAKSLAGLVLAAGGLLGVGLALNVTAYWKVGFGLAAAGGVILFLSLMPILLAAASLALPPLRPGRADNGRTLLVLARCLWWALVLLAVLAVVATLSLPDRP